MSGDRDPRDVIKPQVRALAAYTLPPRRARIKVNQNENPWDLPEPIKEEAIRRMMEQPWGRYPEFVPTALREALAAFAGWRADGVLAGNGSNELIQVILACSVGPGVHVVLPEPTFTLYRQMVTVLGGTVVSVPMRTDLGFDVDAMLAAAARTDAALVVACSPNNPTGAMLDEAEVERLAAGVGGLLVLDEAYAEFAGWTAIPLLARHPNLVVLRTFSKALALAGLRFGYAAASPELIGEFIKVRLPYNVGRFTTTAAMVVMERYEELLRPLVHKLIALRQELFDAVGSIDGLRPYPSRANFLLVDSDVPPTVLCDALFERGILARDVSRYPMLDRCFRINVGTPDENAAVVAALAAVLPGLRRSA